MSAADSESEQQQQPALRVQDALGYLDQVKSKFNDQPYVYNQFLDIMKEFKSQALDTPGVIAKVSTLFRGHTDLIIGFNTFLPPGYRIEQMPHNEIRITTLQGLQQNQTPTYTMAQQQPQSQQPQQQRTSPANLIQANQTTSNSSVQQPNLDASTPTAATLNTPITQHNNETRITALIATTAASQQPESSGPTNLTVAATQRSKSNVSPSIDKLYHQAPYSNIQTVKGSIVPGTNYTIAKQQQNPHQQTIVNSSPAIHNSGQPTTVTIQSNMIIGTPQPTVVHQGEGQKQIVQQPPSAMQPGSEFGFNHALNYVNKIKHRFSANPEIYQQFLEILHKYQRDQHATKVPRSKMLLESEVYNHVARLFQNQRDLLEEFSQFLPDANGSGSAGGTINSLTRVHHQLSPSANVNSNPPNFGLRLANDGSVVMNDDIVPMKRQNARGGNHHRMSMKRQNNSLGSYNSTKRPRMTSLRDVSLAEAGKHGSLNEYAFFDKVRKALKSTEVYENFLRCLLLYNHEIVSRTELLGLATNFIGRFPELMKWFKEFLGLKDGPSSGNASMTIDGLSASTQPAQIRQRERDRLSSEPGMEIDYSSCKRHGASYRGLPLSFVQPKCSGRTTLCKEVLNDTLVSFPSWSEDSTFVSSRKTQYEEYIYRCEDERFELDIVIESNLLTIRVLEAVKRKIDKMSMEEKNRFKLDDTLGGTSCVIHQRAIRRIYGDKAPEIIEGLKKNPVIAVPLVLRRLKAKDEEWRDAQKQFNKIWREQNEKYYLKSLDHQGISFKQNDVKYLRSKSLIKEIEDLSRENQDDDLNTSSAGGVGGGGGGGGAALGAEVVASTELTSSGNPHITLVYKDKDMLEEACNLVIHHVKRQTSIHKDEKQKIKQLMRQFIPDLFFAQRGELSDDEIDENEEHVEDDVNSERRFDGSNENNRKTVDQRNNNRGDMPSSPKPKSRFNRESPKLSCDESPLKDPELREPIRPEQQKYLNDIECHNKDEAIPISLDGREHPKMEPLSVITENSSNKESDGYNQSDTQKDSSYLKSPQQALQNKDPEDSYQLFYIDDKWYCFFRLHHILCQRLGSIYERSKILIAEEQKERKDRKESTAIALRLKPRNDIEVEDYFPVFVDMIKQLLDGNLEGNQYEDMLRDMFGIYAYVAFTMDKVVQNIVRQLQHIVGDEVSQQCAAIFMEESKNNGTGGACASAQTRASDEASYYKRADELLDDENCYKATIYKNESKLTIELLESDSSSDDENDENSSEKWANYMSTDLSKDNLKTEKRLFLRRNIRRYVRREQKVNLSSEGDVEKPSEISIDKNGEVKDCSFIPDSCRRLLVFNSGDHVSFYRHQRPTKSRHSRVTDIKRKKFQTWTSKWIDSNLSSDQIRQGVEWLSKTESNSTEKKT